MVEADQFSEMGAITLAIELGAASVDHLETTGADGAQLLAHLNVIAISV